MDDNWCSVLVRKIALVGENSENQKWIKQSVLSKNMACWETCAILAINEAPEETCTARMNSQNAGKNLGKSETLLSYQLWFVKLASELTGCTQ